MGRIIDKLLYRVVNRYQGRILKFVRIWLNNHVDQLTGGVIQGGIFNGQILPRYPWWSNMDRANMLLGLYELELQEVIIQNAKGYDCFVDIGAADGYYLFGLLKLNAFDRYVCFEASGIGRDVIEKRLKAENALNVSLHGKADIDFIRFIDISRRNLILCDIEGAEYEIFTLDNLRILRNSMIIIEIHSKGVYDFTEVLHRLIRNAEKFYTVKMLSTSARDLSKYGEYLQLNDDQRWLLCSEGRAKLGKWLVLTPNINEN